MDLGIKGKRGLVTGASSGIGASTATLLAGEGADVVIAYHANRSGAEESARLVRAAGRTAWLCPLDMGAAASVSAALADVGPIDILVLCAGLNVISPFDELTPAEWDRVIDINLNGTFRVLHAARPHLTDGASIVIVASVAAQTGAPHHAHYAAAKAGLVNLTKSAARSLAPRVRVNCIAPGMTLTPMGRDTAASLPPDYAETSLLTGRFAQPDEIAHFIVFLASPVSGFMTGSTIDVNGGRILR